MKTNKIMNKSILLFLLLLFINTENLFAQNNDMKARIEYEDAETAFQNKEYKKTINYLTNSEKLLGKWTPKVSFLKIQVLDIVTDYSADWNDNMAELYRQVKEYMKYADKNADKVDIDKMREIYAIEKRIDGSKQVKDWAEMQEFKNGQAAYEKKNYEEAMTWYKKAADKGNAYAMFNIGYFYRQGRGVTQNYQEAMTWYKKAADKGNAYAMFNIGYFYRQGQGVTQNYQEAMTWYKKAADKGDVTAMLYIGYLYEKGQGITQNYQEAMTWYKKAADKGNAYAMKNIGALYDDGNGVAQNYQEAMSWYKKAADKGNGYAMYQIGDMYHNGIGITQNYLEAMEWYKKAAERGMNVAAGWIGSFYHKGQGVPQDYDQAIHWYKKALELSVEQNDQASACNLIATANYDKKNYTQAMDWYKKAYEAGDANTKNTAKGWIAKMYEEGLGVEKDKRKAKEWRNK